MKHSKWKLAHGRSLDLDSHGLIMGVLNVTPDSFSDGNLFLDPGKAVEHALQMIEEGADIIDIGGESTRPGNIKETPQEEEEERVMPVIKRLVRETKAILSIDTFREKTALRAMEEGVHIINDVYSLKRSPHIANIAANYQAGLIIMRTGRERDRLPDILDDQKVFLENSLREAKTAGVEDANIVLDVGFGFHKDVEEDMELIANIDSILSFGYPVLVGLSRKRIIGELSGGRSYPERDFETAISSALLRKEGASIFRVHNVAMNRRALNVIDSILEYKTKKNKKHHAE